MMQSRPLESALILAAGRGERMRPLTDSIPKPLLKIGSKTLLEHHLDALVNAGFNRVVINLHHLGTQIREYLGSGGRYGIDILYSWEEKSPLETAGGIRRALNLIDADRFLVVNGDVRCAIQFEELVLPDRSSMHLVLVPNPVHNPRGDFSLDTSGFPQRLCERAETAKNYTFAGIGLYRESVFRDLPEGVLPLAPVISAHIERSTATGEVYDGPWFDIGTPERLKQARIAERDQERSSQ